MEPRKIHYLNIHETGVVIETDIPEIVQWLNFDFSYFCVDSHPSPLLRIQIFNEQPSDQMIPEIAASMHSPEFVCYDEGDLRYVDYYKRAIVVLDYATETARFYSSNVPFLYEKLYLLILSRVGEHLDRRGIHRVHSLGISFRGKSSLFLMPSGGGKSTLALSLLEDPEVQLISEDTPHINARGEVLPFPLRLGIRDQKFKMEIPPEFMRSFSRDKWGTKTLLRSDYFQTQLEREHRHIQFLFVGKWLNSKHPRIEKISRFTTFMTLFRDCVFGLGLPQIVEYFLTTKKGDIVRKAGIALRRVYAVTVLVLKSKPRRVFLSRDVEANKRLILQYLSAEV